VRRDSAADTRTHGYDGLGGVHLPPAERTADPRGAVALLLETLERSAEPVTVIALGPLTNIAALLAAHPAAVDRIERVVVMGGGARDLGNMTPTAEFNIWFDPEAAARVFAAGLPLTMVGLDVTHRARTHPGDWALLRASGGPIARALLPMVDFYTAYHLEVDATDATAQHDALAVAAVIDPGLVTTQRLHVDVECVGPLTRGMTVVDVNRHGGGQPATDVALEVDAKAFNRLLVTRVAQLDARSA
ncbi:MAG TPA: nucleoside hydrolase, partial [Cellulomonas sp.]|nr:nucleoside hydrolase [Cellulomonas sp.]